MIVCCNDNVSYTMIRQQSMTFYIELLVILNVRVWSGVEEHISEWNICI